MCLIPLNSYTICCVVVSLGPSVFSDALFDPFADLLQLLFFVIFVSVPLFFNGGLYFFVFLSLVCRPFLVIVPHRLLVDLCLL